MEDAERVKMRAAETEKMGAADGTEKTAAAEDKAYIHWLYQAAGFNSRGFLRSLASLGTPR